MRKRGLAIVLGICLIAAGTACWYWAGRALETHKTSDLIRIHVIANSDSEVDQAIKFKVRDAVVQAITPEVQDIRTPEEAREVIKTNIAMIHSVSTEQVRQAGSNDPVRVYYGQYPFPDRTYGSWTVPAGQYEAVRVVIGEGDGQNWWCVLFPPLCFVNDLNTSVPAVTGPTGPVEVKLRFKAADLWADALRWFR